MLPQPTGPLVLTLTLDKATQSLLTGLRTKYFPAHRNHLAAHITLFHAIPPHRIEEFDRHVQSVCASRHPFDVYVGEPRKMSYGGVMLLVRERPSGSVGSIHDRLLRALKKGVSEEKDNLTKQDLQGMSRAHVTVLNKAGSEEEVEKCLQEVTELFEGMKRPGQEHGQHHGQALGFEL